MAGTSITIDKEELERLAGAIITIDKAELERLRAFMDAHAKLDTSGLMSRLGEYLLKSTQDRFKSQTSPDGASWAPLKKRYARRKKYNKDKVLTLRGYLRSYIHYQIPNAQTVVVGSNQKYAAIHQFGGEIDKPERQATARYRSVAGRVLFAKKSQTLSVNEKAVTIGAHQVKIKARPFLGISAADDREIQEIIREWVIGQGLK